MRAAWPIMTSILLGGCALPPVVSVASYVADGASYASSGKSLSDHGMTIMSGHDCSLVRNLTQKGPVCESEIAQRADPAPVEVGRHQTARADRYVTMGSFANRENAEKFMLQFAGLVAKIIPVDIAGKHFHRVVVGPVTAEEATALKAKISAPPRSA